MSFEEIDVPDSNLRLAIVAPGEFFGGAERQILNLLTHLCRGSIECDLILLFDRELADQARRLGVRPKIIGAGRRFDFGALMALQDLLRTRRYNVVHAHGYKAMVMAALARMRCKFALIKTEHGRAESGVGTFRERMTTGAYRRAENALSRLTQATIVYVTRDLQRFYEREHVGISSCVIFNGIDANDVVRLERPVELSTQTFNVVVLGRLEHVKGTEYAIRAMQADIIPDDVRLHIVGDGPLRESLTQLAAAGGHGRSIVFHGFRQDGVRFAAHADVLLMPSLHEGLPYTLLEAIAAGTPVAASEVGGLAEILENQRTALLFRAADPSAISTSIARLRDDDVLRRTCAVNARSQLLPRFSSDTMGDAYVALYRQLAEPSRTAVVTP